MNTHANRDFGDEQQEPLRYRIAYDPTAHRIVSMRLVRPYRCSSDRYDHTYRYPHGDAGRAPSGQEEGER